MYSFSIWDSRGWNDKVQHDLLDLDRVDTHSGQRRINVERRGDAFEQELVPHQIETATKESVEVDRLAPGGAFLHHGA